ncbi:putative sensor histidine kinase [Feldmannia species virus]|uniref:histidine kinase n=1 Tax=Feldmannia species virus TaxID=39420 RepID=B5LWA6_9PHYC|nr:putative sensor histidine kinase [Feldmannia species virus]ACH46769.1 putative sensor histidine kinase [Feldmannia species virus]
MKLCGHVSRKLRGKRGEPRERRKPIEKSKPSEPRERRSPQVNHSKGVLETKAQIRMMISCLREIQTPVNDLLGLTDIVPKMDPDSSLYLYAVCMNTFGNLLARMIENMRLYYQLSSGIYDPTYSNFVLRSEIHLFWRSLTSQARSHRMGENYPTIVRTGDVSCKICILETVPNDVVSTDTKVLQKIFHALVDNAIRFTQEGLIEVIVSCQKVGKTGYVLNLVVSDTGVGVPTELRQILFEPMTRGHVESVAGGAGMSLAVARLLCRRLGGDVTLDDDKDCGCTFRASLRFDSVSEGWPSPVWENEFVLSGKAVSTDDRRQSESEMPHILVVDDIRLNREILKHHFKRLGIKIFTACDGDEAVKECVSKKFDLIFMDIYMPRLNGVEACKLIKRECPLNLNTPVVALTVSSSTMDHNECLRAGMVEMVTKPVDRKKLIHVSCRSMDPKKSLWISESEIKT